MGVTASVMAPAMDSLVGRFAVLAGPQNAFFRVIQLSRRS
jgi:hypothetical protein